MTEAPQPTGPPTPESRPPHRRRWIDEHIDASLPEGSRREPWDTGPLLVRRAPRVLVVVGPGAGKPAASLIADR